MTKNRRFKDLKIPLPYIVSVISTKSTGNDGSKLKSISLIIFDVTIENSLSRQKKNDFHVCGIPEGVYMRR